MIASCRWIPAVSMVAFLSVSACAMLALFVYLSLRTSVPTTTALPVPRSIVYDDLAHQLSPLTQAQRDAILKPLVGARIAITGTVRDVYASGRVDVASGKCNVPCVILESVPKETALTLKSGQPIAIVGTVTRYSTIVSSVPTLWIRFESID